MNMEWIKIFKNKKIVGMLVVLLVFQLFFYLYTIEHKQFYDGLETYGSQEQFEESFYSYVEKTIKRADSMGNISVFGEMDSFSKSNLELTKQDFLKILDVKPVLFDDEYFIRFFDHSFTHVFAFLAGIVITIVFIDEKKPGIRNIIFASKNGRCRLILYKISSLFLWSGLISLFFYGGTLLVSAYRYEQNLFDCFVYPIQSIRILMGIPWKINIGTFLLLFWIYRTISLFITMFLLWGAMFFVDNLMVSIECVGIIGLISYIIHILIPNNHPLNILHYGNLWYQITSNEFMTEYRNLNFFSNAVRKEIIVFATWGIWLLVLFCLSFFSSEYKYPCKSFNKAFDITTKLKVVVRTIKRLYCKIQEKLSLQMVEFYKVLISQKGIIIFGVLILVIIYNTEYKEQLTTGSQKLFIEFVNKYEGVPSEASKLELQELEVFLMELETGYVQAMEAFKKGEITEKELWQWNTKYDLYESERYFIKAMQDYNVYLEELKDTRGIEGWYVNLYSYNHLFKNKNRIVDIVLLLGIVLLCSGIFSYDKQYDMESMIRACKEGRTNHFKKKMWVCISLTCIIMVIATLFELSNTMYLYNLSGLSAPVQSLSMLSFVPFQCSIGAFIVLLYLFKTLIVCFVGLFVTILAIFIKQKVCVAVAIVLCVPDLLSMIGIPLFENMSVIRVLSTAAFMIEGNSIWSVIWIMIVLGIVAIVSVCVGHKKWCYS